MSDQLPALVTTDGEVVTLITAEHLLHAAGITDPRISELGDLAVFMSNADHLASLAREAKTTVSDEVVRRMDRGGKWTLHEGNFTLTSSSPSAGTEKYDDERLAAALARLVEDDVIDQDAATAAIEWVRPPAPAPFWKQKTAGIKALLKLGGQVADAVLSAQEPVEPPRRAAKVKRRQP